MTTAGGHPGLHETLIVTGGSPKMGRGRIVVLMEPWGKVV